MMAGPMTLMNSGRWSGKDLFSLLCCAVCEERMRHAFLDHDFAVVELSVCSIKDANAPQEGHFPSFIGEP